MRIWEKEKLYILLVGAEIETVIIENNKDILQEVENRTTLRSSNPTSGYTSKGPATSLSKRSLHCCVRSSSIRNSRDMEKIAVFLDRR